ncbi:MAG: PEP-CTERM sorting domain-containing protein [Terriglobia bacterium]
MPKMKLAFNLAIVCLLVVLGSAYGLAGQYVIGASNQNVTIIANGSGSMNVTFGTCTAVGGNSVCTLSGEAFTSTPGMSLMPYILEETYTGSGPSPVTAGPGKNGIFNLNMNGAAARISFNGGAAWKSIQYTAFTNGAMNPEAYGTWNGSTSPFEFALENIDMNGRCSLGVNCSLNSLTSGAKINSAISSGEFDLDDSPSPEPASLGLFGIGLLAIAFLIRSRSKDSV